MSVFCPKPVASRWCPIQTAELASDFDDDDECEFLPGLHEIWEPAELDDEDETEPEVGDFWIEPDQAEDVLPGGGAVTDHQRAGSGRGELS